jgi:hypothetical protein
MYTLLENFNPKTVMRVPIVFPFVESDINCIILRFPLSGK